MKQRDEILYQQMSDGMKIRQLVTMVCSEGYKRTQQREQVVVVVALIPSPLFPGEELIIIFLFLPPLSVTKLLEAAENVKGTTIARVERNSILVTRVCVCLGGVNVNEGLIQPANG